MLYLLNLNLLTARADTKVLWGTEYIRTRIVNNIPVEFRRQGYRQQQRIEWRFPQDLACVTCASGWWRSVSTRWSAINANTGFTDCVARACCTSSTEGWSRTSDAASLWNGRARSARGDGDSERHRRDAARQHSRRRRFSFFVRINNCWTVLLIQTAHVLLFILY